MQFNKFLSSVFLAVLYASTSAASPLAPSAKFSTHGVREIGDGVTLEAYHPESSFETFGSGIDHPLRKRADATVEDAALAFVEFHLGIQSEDVVVKSTSEADEIKHAYIQQKVNGVPYANAVANVAFNKDDKVVAFGSSFVKSRKVAGKSPKIKPEDAVAVAEGKLNATFDKTTLPAPKLEYLAKQDGSASLTYVVQVRNAEAFTWYEAFVDAHTGELASVTDFSADAKYRVVPIASQTPVDSFVDLVDPQDLSASPEGWHTDKTTAGNNAVAYIGSPDSVTPQSGDDLEFLYDFDATISPTEQSNPDVARTNAFYVVNTVHDIAYKYGFTEASFNFQDNNFGNSGKGNDRVNISVQDASGKNNARFSTPPDGQNGLMQMFLWTQSSPLRDGSIENDVIAHEFTHGISNRLTGGGSARCLQTTEARGMGEGWSDAFAEWTEHTSANVTDFILGAYVYNYDGGLRSYPYSTSKTTNPLRYSTIAKLNEVHDIGEVWANMLHNVYAALVEKFGFSSSAHTDPSGPEGNVVYLHLFMDSLALQPCNPTLVASRDAWLQADANRYGGANKCLLWNAFASRGLGQKARNFRDDSTVPAECKDI